MADRVEIRIAGLGGQGVVMAGALMGEAAARAGIAAAGSSSYGSQARGGSCRSDVVLARSGEIDFPHVHRPDVLAVMSDEAYRTYLPEVAASGAILFDPYYVKPDPADGRAHHEVAATRAALDDGGGSAQGANIVMLGAVAGFTGLVGVDALAAIVAGAFPARFSERNARLLGLGHGIGERLAKGGGK